MGEDIGTDVHSSERAQHAGGGRGPRLSADVGPAQPGYRAEPATG